MLITVGADPEVFVKKNNCFVSGYKLIEGTKVKPFKVDKGAVQVDGMALEFNIDPAHTLNQFRTNINEVLKKLKSMVPEHEISINSFVEFEKKYFDSQPEEAKELGCDPDFNAWTLEVNPAAKQDNIYRMAGGHVHVGWTKDKNPQDFSHVHSCGLVCRELDFYLGLPSLFLDKDNRRRESYGKAGCFRPKTYGVEYRTLSNFWIKNDKTIEWVFNSVQKCMRNLIDHKHLSKKCGDIQSIINNSDLEMAKQIIKDENLEVPNVVL